MSEVQILFNVLVAMRGEIVRRHRDEGGYSTESALVIAGLGVAALTVVGIIAAKVISSANSIPSR